jgi:DNA-binding Lrp family transcriptional regulator
MRDVGVIQAENARIDPASVGFPLTCIVSVDIEREGAADLTRFKKKMMSCSGVQQCYYVTGDTDFIVIVLVRNMADYEAFTREHLLSDPNVRRFTTHVVMEQVKTGISVPLGKIEK